MRRRAAVLWTCAVPATLAVLLAAACWYYSDEIIRPEPWHPLESGLRVLGADDSTILLPTTPRTREAEVWFIQWSGGYGMARAIVRVDSARVARRFQPLVGRPAPGEAVQLAAYPYTGDPLHVFGVPFENVRIPSSLGPLPAWRIAGAGDVWVVLVHGMGAGRGEPLRLLPVLRALELPSLIIGYRNDRDAPQSPDGLYHLGATEWQDLEAGVRYALRHGARRVVLMGYSMGGAMVANFIDRSPLADSVRAVVLDAPVLDWDAAVQLAAHRRSVPTWLTRLAESVVSLRIGFEWRGFEGRVQAERFRVPVLLFHGTADRTVPITSTERFAAALGARATLVRTEGAGHIQSWNYQPQRYQDTLRRWLAATLAMPGEAGLPAP
jgi:pimeloyl-ACP methyl ester carboxylesterase